MTSVVTGALISALVEQQRTSFTVTMHHQSAASRRLAPKTDVLIP